MKSTLNQEPQKLNDTTHAHSRRSIRLIRFFKGMFASSGGCGGDCKSNCCGCVGSERSLCLADLKVGQKAIILGVKTGSACQFKLLDLGLSSGIDVIVRERAPFGGPMIVKARETVLALRPTEASCIKVSLHS